MKYLLLMLIAVVTLTGCFYTGSAPQLEEKIGKKTVQTINGSSRITVAMDSNQFQLLQCDVAMFKKLLLNDEGYVFDRIKKCIFIPQLAFKSDGVIVMVNYYNNQVKFITDEKSVVIDYDPMQEEYNAFINEILVKMDNDI